MVLITPQPPKKEHLRPHTKNSKSFTVARLGCKCRQKNPSINIQKFKLNPSQELTTNLT